MLLRFLNVIVKELLIDYICRSLFPNEDILTKEEIESWKGFADSLSSKEDKGLFKSMLNDCYKQSATINSKGQPFPAEPLLIALLLLSQRKIIDWLTKQISKYELLVNTNNNSKEKEDKKAKQLQKEQNLARENTHDYIRKNERIHYIDDDDYY